MRTGRTITSVKRPWPAREAGREPRSAPSSVIAGYERLCVRRTTVGAGAGPVIRRGCRGRTHWIRDFTAFERRGSGVSWRSSWAHRRAAAAAADRVWPSLFPWRAERKLNGFRLAATDCSWSAGDGLLVEGPIGAILLLLTGRQAGLARLSGPGARELSAVGLDQQAAQDLA